MNDLVVAFNEYFEVISANSHQLLQEVYRLRYQVYCQETGFEDPSNFPSGLETDIYDERSTHCLLRHRRSGNYVGAIRLILVDPVDYKKPFPLECTQIDPKLVDVSKLPRQHIAEISRVVILNRFPHRKEGDRRRYNIEEDIEIRIPTRVRRFPHPILGLMVGLIQMCAEHNIIHWYAVMDPALNRLLSIYGLHLDPIGPLTDYHGLRRPYFIDLIKVLSRMYVNHPLVWELLTNYGKVWPAALERRAHPRVAINHENILVPAY